MSNPNPARVAAGTPDGGRFAPDPRAESAIALEVPSVHGTEQDTEDARLDAALTTEIATYQAANSRIQLLSAKLTARTILREYPEATHLSLDYSDQAYGEMVPGEVLDCSGGDVTDDVLGNDFEDADYISELVGNLNEHGDWTVCRDYADQDDQRRGERPRLNLASAAALDTDQIAGSTGIKSVSPAPEEADDQADDYDNGAICLCDAVTADRRPYRNCPIHGAARAAAAPAEEPAVEQPPASPFETSAIHRTEPAPIYREKDPAYKAAIRSAQRHLGQFRMGDVVAVTGENGTEHFARVISDRLSDGQYGSPESRTVGASLGLGKYTFDVTSHKLAMGSVGIRAARPDELAAAQTQFDDAEAANVVRQQQRINQANSRLTELGLPQVGEEAVAWPESDFPVRGRVHDVSADGRTVSIVRDGHAGTSQLPADVIAPAAP